MLKRYLPVKPLKSRSFLLMGFILFIYLLDNLPISFLNSYKSYSNILKPIFWISLSVMVWIFSVIRPKAPLKLRGSMRWWAFNFAAINIIISVIAGLIHGFGKSPYDHSLQGYLTNILMVGTMLAGREAVRSYSVNSLARDENFRVFIPISLFMTLSNFTISRFTNLDSFESVVKFIAQFLLPEFLQNLLATYLAFLGGWIPSLIYMGILQAFNWLSPILPNLKWITAALVGIMCPVFSLTAMQGIYMNETKMLKKIGKGKENLAGWIVTSVFSIGIIWFAVGVFPLYPSVIATGSMEPIIKPGDMILVQKILKTEDIDQLKAGDIIQFKRGNILISHRIIEIVKEEKVKRYRTKGDNNSSPDAELVKPQDLKGRIKFVVPKIGWPTLLIKRKDDVPMEKVEF